MGWQSEQEVRRRESRTNKPDASTFSPKDFQSKILAALSARMHSDDRVDSKGWEIQNLQPSLASSAPSIHTFLREDSSISIRWNPLRSAQLYELQYRFKDARASCWGNWVLVSNSLRDTSHCIPVREEAVYSFRVRASVGEGWSPWSMSSEACSLASLGWQDPPSVISESPSPGKGESIASGVHFNSPSNDLPSDKSRSESVNGRCADDAVRGRV
ncbi:hypothetical protein GUITHDRAFT_105793 [Guillardia theta CCMP2712]|uniref:Fibronectin type-III domain-containing protein n=1 Tax=Guillardia theta (strain CCMP2712) TaxID=905079 RepID=L1JJE5_GUITC|nr:hypothetical protein GUITHDRAFT_105793 [Guillardia theta CCMP2712]EKX48648.1 hypothetical protein GUITHDRAFT_105793 [Guillardia theta CCMP2712]|eukprot:XP_005835628.1 hypothetical protein GUITHDRAFT_105793 [Guillardia theta CCMP2712]